MSARPRIVPHLWYDREAREAAEFYASVFPDSRVTGVTTLRGTPSGECDVVWFEVLGRPFMAISAGPHFRFNPSVSFFVNRDSADEIDALWAKLIDGGEVLMPLDSYPFSPRYGWVQDRFGLSWQLIQPMSPDADWRPPVMPCLLFVDENCGNAEAALDFYLSAFRDTKRGEIVHYGADQPPNREGTLMYGDCLLEGQWFALMDSAEAHDYGFNEAVSFIIRCDDQQEVDRYWAAMSAVPEAEQCGWLKDRFGLSWQVAPAAMERMLSEGTPEQVDRLTQAFLPMKKFDLAALKRAYEG
jgi:predicted 3-demethylubiquinone-9 3-methyltransferase (glyoxalase superfamily)